MDTLFQITGATIWIGIGLIVLSNLFRLAKERSKVDISGRWIVITGCNSGFGLGVAKKLADAGANIIAFTFTEVGAQRALEAGAKLSPRLDITDEQAVLQAVIQVKELCGGELWGVIHNAGMAQPGHIEYQLLENYRRVMEVNYFAAVRLTQPLIPLLKKARGRVVFLSSVGGIVAHPGNATYDASKYAIEAFADALRVELSFWNVYVAVVNPSTMKTPLVQGYIDLYRRAWEMMEKQDPAGAWKEAWTKEWLENYIAVNKPRVESMAQNPQIVIDDIEHALTAKYPRFRYLSGMLAKTLFRALWKMPETWSFHFKKATIDPKPTVK